VDADRFDRLTKTLAGQGSRREALRRLGGVGLGALLGAGAPARDAAACAPDETACRVKRNGKKRTVCVPAGQCCPGLKLCSDRCEVCCDNERACAGKKGRVTCVPGDQCCPDDRQCFGGGCARPGECCPDERRCVVRGKPDCFPSVDCCPDERRCPDGQCVKPGVCCSGERTCTKKVKGDIRQFCVPYEQCCPNQKRCSATSCIDASECCPGTERTCKKRVNGRERTFCVPAEQCCPGREVPCAIAPDGCCNAFAGEECAEFDGCCNTLDAEKFVCDGKWCCDKGDECVAGVGCRKPAQCPVGETDCAAPNGEITACCNEGELCCNGICCAKSIAPVSKCCGTRQACYGIGSPCPA
jgi:hypothetical protein